MQDIQMASDLMAAVRSGEKTSTVRRGCRSYTLGVALITNASDPSDHCTVRVWRAYWTTVREYDPAYLEQLLPHYPDITLDDNVTVVEWK